MEMIEPISYVYDPKNPDERQVEILNQVKSFCQISQEQEDTDTWTYIWQVLRRLSLVTCWANKPEDTFIKQTRIQKFSAKQVNGCRRGCCHCDEDIVKVNLAFEPISEYISGEISVVIGGKVVSQEIPLEYLNDHTDWRTGILYINREDFPNVLLYHDTCCCLCNRNLIVTLVYNAGYDNLPSGLLPVFCKMMEAVDTDTSDSCASNMTSVSGALKRKKVGNVEYEWSDKDDSIYNTNKLLSELGALGVLGEVMAFSRCAISEEESDTGVVV